MFKRFKSLDKNNTGGLDVDKFLAVPNLEHNPLVRRVVATFDDDKVFAPHSVFDELWLTFTYIQNGVIDFTEFIKNLSIFASKSTEGKEEEKTKCMCNHLSYISVLPRTCNNICPFTVAFRMYDVNNDGYISNGDLFKILKIMVGNNLTDTQLQQVSNTKLVASWQKN